MAVDGPEYLVDNSAYNRLSQDSVRSRLQPLLAQRLIATCAVVELEALFSAKTPADYVRVGQTRKAILRYIETEEADLELAVAIQSRLAARSQVKSGKIPDLIMAAMATRNNLTLLHYDKDFELIAAVEDRFKHDWVVPRGSVS